MKFSFENLGFTKSEARILVIALSVLTLGFCIKYSGAIFADSDADNFDFTQSDLEFKEKSNTEPDKRVLEEGVLININTASIEELSMLNGIGESLAEEIIAYRENVKKFSTPKDILKVKGIGKKKFEQIKNKIKVE